MSVDYRNFPQVTIPKMVDDIDDAMMWVFENIARFGGDVDNIHLVGQSAGAHLTAMLLLRKAAATTQRRGPHADVPTATACVPDSHLSERDCRRLKSWVGISGPYDLARLLPTLHRRGLHSR